MEKRERKKGGKIHVKQMWPSRTVCVCALKLKESCCEWKTKFNMVSVVDAVLSRHIDTVWERVEWGKTKWEREREKKKMNKKTEKQTHSTRTLFNIGKKFLYAVMTPLFSFVVRQIVHCIRLCKSIYTYSHTHIHLYGNWTVFALLSSDCHLFNVGFNDDDWSLLSGAIFHFSPQKLKI